MGYRVETRYMAHTGGTKFYEITLITNESTDKTVLAYRWGKLRMPGFAKVEKFGTVGAANVAANEQQRRKQKPHGADNGYYQMQGLAKVERYADVNGVADAIPKAILDCETWTDEISEWLGPFTKDATAVPKAPPAPAAVIDRGEMWASW